MMQKREGNTDVICDLQYGSTGKGLIAGYLATTGEYDTVISANMPNAGHTYIDQNNQVMVHKVLPSGVVGPKIKNVMIGPGSIFDILQLEQELSHVKSLGYRQWQLWIHEAAIVLRPEHRAAEEADEALVNIGSTKQGSSAAMIQKILRSSDRSCLAKDVLIPSGAFGILSQGEWLQKIHSAKEILVEGAQGYSLGINSGFWPYCTSRDCTPSRILSDCGVPHSLLRRVIGTARIHPIRVAGNSGGCYPDQEEISWEALGVRRELTTVTKKVRRVFTWSSQQIKEAILACSPDHIFLNFCNYDPSAVPKIVSEIQRVGGDHAPIVQYSGWGPRHDDVHARQLDPCDMTRVEINRGNA